VGEKDLTTENTEATKKTRRHSLFPFVTFVCFVVGAIARLDTDPFLC